MKLQNDCACGCEGCYLELIADVDDEGIREGMKGDPLAIFENLKARDLGVLKKDCKCIGISMAWQAIGQLWLWAWRIVVHCHVLPLFSQHLPYVIFFKPQALSYVFLYSEPQLSNFYAVVSHYFPVHAISFFTSQIHP